MRMEIENIGDSRIDDQSPLISTLSWCEYIKYKMFHKNAFIDFYNGTILDDDGGKKLDEAVNAQALVCALILTIPFGVVGNFNFEYYETIQTISINCEQYDYKQAHSILTRALLSVIYSSIIGLIFSTLYYILRPINIKLWWNRGKYFYLLLFAITTTSVISLLNLTSTIIGYYALAPDGYCSSYSNLHNTAYAIVTMAFLICIILLF